jgi:hypothetical protein
MFFGDFISPGFDSWPCDFNSFSTLATDQMVVVGIATFSIDSLAIIACDGINFSRSG